MITVVLKNVGFDFRHADFRKERFQKRIGDSLRRYRDNIDLGINFYI